MWLSAAWRLLGYGEWGSLGQDQRLGKTGGLDAEALRNVLFCLLGSIGPLRV